MAMKCVILKFMSEQCANDHSCPCCWRFTFVSLCVADIYVCCVSHTHMVAAKNYFIAMVATSVETANPENELKPGLDLLGPVEEKYVRAGLGEGGWGGDKILLGV